MGRLEVRITPADVGKRVSVRRLAETGGSGGRFTDTVGVLTSWDSGVLVVTRRSGDRVRIAQSTLVAGKIVPAAPARRPGLRASYEELGRVAARAWQPVECERLGGWALRAAVRTVPTVPNEQSGGGGRDGGGTRRVGFTRRANSVLPLGDPGMPLDEALSRVRAWYACRGLPPYIQAATGAEGTQEVLCARLEEAGWVRKVSAALRIAPLARLADAAGSGRSGAGAAGSGPDAREAAVRRVLLTRDVDAGWLRRYSRYGDTGGGGVGDGDAGPAAEPDPAVRAVLAAGPSVWFASVPGDDTDGGDGGSTGGGLPAAIGRCVVDGRWAGFMAVEVAPQARRRGLATAVLTALARQALHEGASAAWLQAGRDDTAATALYDGMGFDVHHVYHHYRG